MIITVVVVIGWLCLGIRSSSQKLVPNRLQASVELLFNFINDLSQSYMGPKGCVFLPLHFKYFSFYFRRKSFRFASQSPYFYKSVIGYFGACSDYFYNNNDYRIHKAWMGIFKIFMPRVCPYTLHHF